MKNFDATWLSIFATVEHSALWTVAIVLGTIVVLLALFVAALPWIVQPFLRMMLFLRYDLKRIGLENVPRTGPVLLVSNHVSWYDGFFLAASIPRRGTALMNANVFAWPVVGYLARRCGLISVPYSGPKALRESIETCRKVLDEGKLLGIFPEGQLTRNGMTGTFQRGLEVILGKREDVTVIPVYLDNVWGSIMSFSEDCFLWKRPKGWRRTIIVAFGPPIEKPVTAFSARQAVLVQGVKARAALARTPERPAPIDFTLPHFDHPTLGPLTASAADIHALDVNVHQIGTKPGSVGLTLPGVAIRAVDDQGKPLGPDVEGRLQALVPGQADWSELDRRGHLDKEGFLYLAEAGEASGGRG
jgi:1-acyl-sn-glycerol-3-phosphate acyltransferase